MVIYKLDQNDNYNDESGMQATDTLKCRYASSLDIESGISYVWWTRCMVEHDNFPFFNGKTALNQLPYG